VYRVEHGRRAIRRVSGLSFRRVVALTVGARLPSKVLVTAMDRVSLPSDSADERFRKGTLVVTAGVLGLCGAFWSLTYAALGVWRAAAIPLAFQVVCALCIAVALRTRRVSILLYQMLTMMLLLPFALQWVLGGFLNASAVMVWAFMSPVGALVFLGPRRSRPWFVAFAALALVSGLVDGTVASRAPTIPGWAQTALFVLNIGGVSAVVFVMLQRSTAALRRAREKSDRLLYGLLPPAVAERLREGSGPVADSVDEVTVLFADLVGFTPLTAELAPHKMITFLNRLFARFDALAMQHGVEKIATLGDGYVAVAGVPQPRQDHAQAAADMALDMLEETRQVTAQLGHEIEVRIGIHTGGPVVAGVIGTTKYLYSIVGDAMNTASRMESHGLPGQIQVSAATRERLGDRYAFTDRGIIEVKGKGPMRVFLLSAASAAADPAPRAAPVS
jgi:adenylate cyclase